LVKDGNLWRERRRSERRLAYPKKLGGIVQRKKSEHRDLSIESLLSQVEDLRGKLALAREGQSHLTTEYNRLQHEREIESLAQIICRSGSLSELLDWFGAQLRSMPEIDGCVVTLARDDDHALVISHLNLPISFAGIQSSYRGFQYDIDGNDVNAVVCRSGSSVFVTANDLDRYAETTRMRFERWKMRNLLVLPLAIGLKDGGTQCIGTVMVFGQVRLLDEHHERAVREVADLFAPQIRTHWRHQQGLDKARMVDAMHAELQQFLAYITAMNSLTSVDEVYALISKEFIHRFKFDFVVIQMENQGELELSHFAFSEPFRHLAAPFAEFRSKTHYTTSARDGQSGVVFVNNQRFVINDVEKILGLPMGEKDRTSLEVLKTARTYIVMPIRLNNVPIGTLTLATLDHPIDFPDTELTLIELLGSFISTAIRNAMAHGMVEQKNREIAALNQELNDKVVLLDQIARKDRLTGLNNFGAFEEELKRRTSEYERVKDDSALSMILIDVDHFKRFNDQYGHPAGNVVLQEVATRILKAVRDMDFVARFGGEEFVVLLPKCDLPGAAMIAERIRSKIGDESFIVDGAQRAITVSAGYARFNSGETPRAFSNRVDSALYAAKANGRNRVESS
jgi:two-component system cell cycle response regulator